MTSRLSACALTLKYQPPAGGPVHLEVLVLASVRPVTSARGCLQCVWPLDLAQETQDEQAGHQLSYIHIWRLPAHIVSSQLAPSAACVLTNPG